MASSPTSIQVGHTQHIVQPNLTVNKPDDRYEREADAVADQVMRIEKDKSSISPSMTPLPAIQRKCATCEAQKEEQEIQRKETSSQVPSLSPTQTQQLHASRGHGQALLPETQQLMSQAIGQDFGQVKVHTDARAAHLNRAIHAKAFTYGSDIYFNQGAYQPQSSTGKHLLAHELTHVIQQRGATQHIQRLPLEEEPYNTQSLHDSITKAYSEETGTPHRDGLQYTDDYAQWIKVRAGGGAHFKGHTDIQENPLDRQKRGLTPGKTFLTLNGTRPTGANVGALVDDYKRLTTPSNIQYQLSPDGNSYVARFDYHFDLVGGAEIHVATPPSSTGWKAKMTPLQATNAAFVAANPDCAAVAQADVTLRGHPTDQAYAQKIKDSELEHVNALRVLFDRHFVPYYRFVMGLEGHGASQADAETDLRQKVGKRGDQAAMGFVLGDLAATRRFDDPTSTHHATLTPTASNKCQNIQLDARQTNPPLPGSEPGNVIITPPQAQTVNSTALTLSGLVVTDGAGFRLSVPDATTGGHVMSLFQGLHITEVKSMGSLHILTSNGKTPSGNTAPFTAVSIDPSLYQVTSDFPNPGEWYLSEVQGDRFLEIAAFGTRRDAAYSAEKALKDGNVHTQLIIGANPSITFFL